jgi:hypothetical protein
LSKSPATKDCREPPIVDELVTEGMVTLEAVRILKYVASPAR